MPAGKSAKKLLSNQAPAKKAPSKRNDDDDDNMDQSRGAGVPVATKHDMEELIDENECYQNETVNPESFFCSCCWVGQGQHSLKPKQFSEEEIKVLYQKWEAHFSKDDPNQQSIPKSKKKKKKSQKKPEMDLESIFENKMKREESATENQEQKPEDSKMEEENEEEDNEQIDLEKTLNLAGDHENSNMQAEDDEDDPSNQVFGPTDSFFISVKNDDDPSAVVYRVKDTKKGDSFKFNACNEITLSAQPVCCDWVGHKFASSTDSSSSSTEQGHSYLAVGYAGYPVIEIWDLDVADLIPPVCGLGEKKQNQTANTTQQKKAKKVTDLLSADAHKASVISLSWNKKYTHFLASGSQDHTVKIWDLNSQKCVQTLTNIFNDDVSAVCWDHYGDQRMLFCGSGNILVYLDPRGNYKRAKNDDIIAVGNTNNNNFSVSVAKINKQTHGGINSISVNPFNPNEIAVSFDKGFVEIFDKRRLSAGAIASFIAYKGKMVSGLDWSKKQKDVLFCCSCESNQSLCLLRKENNGTVTLVEECRSVPTNEESGDEFKSKVFCLSCNDAGFCGLGFGLPENLEVFDEEELMGAVDEDEEMGKASTTN